MKKIKTIIEEYTRAGGKVSYSVDKDGHIRVKAVDGVSFRSREGASYLRRITGNLLTAAELAIRQKGSRRIATLAESGISIQSEKTLEKWALKREKAKARKVTKTQTRTIGGKKVKVKVKMPRKVKSPKGKKPLPKLTKKEEAARRALNRKLRKQGKTGRISPSRARQRKAEELEKRRRGVGSENVKTILKRTERHLLGLAYIANIKTFCEYIGAEFSASSRGYGRIVRVSDIYDKNGSPYNFGVVARLIWKNRERIQDLMIKEARELVYDFIEGRASGKETSDKLMVKFQLNQSDLQGKEEEIIPLK